MRFRRFLPRYRGSYFTALLTLGTVVTTLAGGGVRAQSGRTATPGVSVADPPSRITPQRAGRPAMPAPSMSDAAKARQLASYSKLPLSFVPNQGQTDPQVKFTSQGQGYALFLTPTEAVLSLYKPTRQGNSLLPGEHAKADVESSGVLRMKMAGARSTVVPTGAGLLPGKSNYYIGNDSRKWLANVPNYGRVTYSDVYPGVDLVYYGSNQQQLEYDFVLKPGVDPRAIRIAFDLGGMSTAEKNAALSIESNGDLLVQGSHGDVRFRKPQVYQPDYMRDGQGRRNLEGRYVLARGNEVRFAVAGYDHRFPLIIDPTLSFSSYLGGYGPDSGQGIAVDSNSNVDVTGSTASLNFPQPGQPTGPADPEPPKVFVSQINASGSLVYTTIIGGTGGDGAYALALDASNKIFITGTTHSTNFPVTATAFQSQLRGPSDAFLVILNSTGLVTYATYGGGAGNEDGFAIYVDSNENIYIGGDTSSTGNILGSYSATGYQENYGGGSSDGFLAVISSSDGVQLTYLTYFGGTGTDAITGVTADTNGNAYVAGRTSSPSFISTTPTTILPSYGGSDGSFNAFVAEFSVIGATPANSLEFFTYLGGSGDNEATGIALDPLYIADTSYDEGDFGFQLRAIRTHQKDQPEYSPGAAGTNLYSPDNIYVTGSTNNPANFFQGQTEPTTSVGPGGGKDGFIVKIAPFASSPVVYSNFFGGSGDDVAYALMVDLSDNVYVVGATNSTNFPQSNPAPGSCVNSCGTGNSTDAFLARLDPEGVNLVYSSYLGGSAGDLGAAVAQDINGGTWLTGSTASTDFPTQSPFQSALGNGNGNSNVFVTDIAGVNPILNLPGFTTTVFPPNDDNSVDSLLGANFNSGNGLSFFGTTFTDVWVNNNGNLSFGRSYGDYTPEGLTTSGLPPIIAPYWADVETYGGNPVPSGVVTYGNDTVNGFSAFGVDYFDVGYFASATDKLASFQVVLIDRHDVAPGDFDIEFNYGKIQWEAGDASGGDDGLCQPNTDCSSAHIGYSNGTGVPGTYYELPGSGVFGAFLDSNTSTGLIRTSVGTNVLGRVYLQVRAGTVQSADLSIGMTPSPSPVALGANLTYTITVTNNGPNSSSGVVVADTIPSNSTFVSATPSQGTCSGTSSVTCSLGTILDGGSATVALVVTVSSGTSISNTASVSASTFDSNPANNTISTNTNVSSAQAPSITKSFGATTIAVSGVTSLTFVINNPNTSVAVTGIGFTDSLPAGLGVATPNGVSGTCGGGTITAVAGSSAASLAGSSLAPSTSCTFSVNVVGTSATEGPVTNSVTVTSSNAGTGNTSTASVTVVVAAGVVSPSMLTFASEDVSLPSAPQTVTLQNVSSSALSITSISVTGANPGDFSQSGTCGATLAAGASCQINVVFDPTATGSRTGTLQVVYNAPGSPQTVSLTGTGVQPTAVPSVTTLAYTHNLNTTCPPKSVTVQNTGTGPLLIGSITTTGSFTQTNNCGTSVAAGANCVINVTFTAEAPVGPFSGTLTVSDNAPGNPQTVGLSGYVEPPCPMASADAAQQMLRTTPTATFNVSDPSPSCHTATIALACSNNQPATCAFNPPAIAPGGSAVLTVQNLNAVSTDNFSFTVTGTDATNTSTVNLSVLLADFTFTPYPTTATVTAGQTATYSMTLTPVNGLAGTIQLACQGAPAGSTCTVTPAAVSLANNYPAQISVAVSTAGRSQGAPRGGAPLSGPGTPQTRNTGWRYGLWLEGILLLALLGLAGGAGVGRRAGAPTLLAYRRLRLSGLMLAALALMLLAWAACGGGGGAGGGVVSNPGTAAGTYSLTVTGTYTSNGQTTALAHTQSLTLQVN